MNTLLYNIPRKSAVIFVWFLLLYEFTTYITNDMIMPGMIQVVHTFNATDNMVPFSLTVYILGGASLQLVLGPLSDRFGRRPVMLIGAVLFLLCSIIIIFTQTIEQFIVARFSQGMGLCFITVVGYSTLHEIFHELDAVRLVSIMNNITILAPLAGPLIGAIIIHYTHWHMIFIIISVLATTSLIGLWLYMPEIVGKQRLDGTLHVSTSLHLSVVYQNYLSLLGNSRFMMGSIANGIAMVPLIIWIGLSPLILIKYGHLSVIDYGLLQFPIFMCVTLGNIIMRRLAQRMKLLLITKLASILLIIGLILTMLLVDLLDKSYWGFIIGLSCYSIGLGMLGAPLNRLTLFSSLIPKGTASALMSLLIMLIMAMGTQLGGWIYHTHNNHYLALFCVLSGITYLMAYLKLNPIKQ